MKSNIIWILTALSLCTFFLTGCNNTSKDSAALSQTAGGWAISTEPVTPDIPESARFAFNDAVSVLTDAEYEPIAYLGSQVVAGSNYGFLCRVSSDSAQSEVKLCTVKIYRNLEGNSSVLETKDVIISECFKDSNLSFTPDNLAGGWNISSDIKSAVLPKEIQTAFTKATKDLKDVEYKPLAYLGCQVVAGSNYAVLCKASANGSDNQSSLAVIMIYADLEGGAQITSVSGFDFP